MYNADYGVPTKVPSGDILWVASTGDNLGPHSPDAIEKDYEQCRLAFPGLRVTASSLDDFARAIRPVVGDLPVVTSEIGDTWIHGVGTDPYKVSAFRELCRLRESWLRTGRCWPDDLTAASVELLKVAEHTWGLDEKTHLDDYEHYRKEDLPWLRETERCRRFEEAWREQRDYIACALKALPSHDLVNEAGEALEKLRPKALPMLGASTPDPGGTQFETESYRIRLSSITGAIWLSITPDVSDWGSWYMQKMGQRVAAGDVVSKGARRLHAVTGPIRYALAGHEFAVESLDAPLIAVGQPELLNFDDRISTAM
jgi:hypothetical protein